MSATADVRPSANAARSSRTVLVVDEDPMTREVVARYLERAGYRTLAAVDGHSAVESAATNRPDLVVLDLMLSGLDGLEVMRRVRATTRAAVILLTATCETHDRVLGLRLGADDYVCKPFSPSELVARVGAVLRRLERSHERARPLRFDGLEIDVAAHRVRVEGKTVRLTPREYDLLLFLARHPGQVFSRAQLIELVWEYSFYTDTTTVPVHIRRLRLKLEGDPGRPERLQTVWGIGYRFAP